MLKEVILHCPYRNHEIGYLCNTSKDGWEWIWCTRCEEIYGGAFGSEHRAGKFLAKFVSGRCVATKGFA